MNRFHISNEIRTGFLVSIIALPLCLGISMASGFPAAAGIVTAIIGGLVASRLGGSPLTIKGPAAGLIVIVLAGVMELGGGSASVGYSRMLTAIAVAAMFQIAFGALRMGRFSSLIPPSVVHGMLAGIGVIIFAKQAHVLLGAAPMAKSPMALIQEIPHSVMNLNPAVAGIGFLVLGVLIGFNYLPARISRKVPSQLVALAIAVPVALFLDFSHAHNLIAAGTHVHVGPEYLVRMPASILGSLSRPDWGALVDLATWKYVLLLALIGSAESLLTVQAVDSLDPKKRQSDVDADLIAVGVGNLLAGLCGGLPMISEIVRSRANIDNGAETSWSNFFHGAFLAAALFLIPGLLNTIPLTVLSAMLLVTAYRLASPKEFAKVFKIGSDQFAIFVVTMVLTVCVDLLVGVIGGVVLKMLLHLARGLHFRDFISADIQEHTEEKTLTITVRGSAVFSNFLAIQKSIEVAPKEVDKILIDFSAAMFVDHTTLERLHGLKRSNGHRSIEMVGLDNLRSVSNHELATRRA